jgi:hypothetical protein
MNNPLIMDRMDNPGPGYHGNDDILIRPLFDEGKDQLLPLLINSKNREIDLVGWIKSNREIFEKYLIKYGGILLRGFEIETVADFNGFMNCFDTDPLPYMFRSSPRKELDDSIKNIYLSTSYPNDRIINMHNESSYSRIWGKKIVFCCIKAAERGGETPLADSRKVLKDIDPRLVSKFKNKGVRYRRNLLADLGMPWQEVFQTKDRRAAEDICRKYQIEWMFGQDDSMVIEWNKPAIYKHRISQEETWFNHILFFNKYSRYEELGLAFDDYLPGKYLTSDTFFGDGSEIAIEEYIEIKNAYQKNKIFFPFQKGDILFLDNMLTAHGRNSYTGDRIIATAIIEAEYDSNYSSPV